MPWGTIAKVGGTILGGPLVAGAVAGGRRIAEGVRQDRDRRGEMQEQYDALIQNILTRSEEAEDRRRPSYEELYGPEAQRATDRIMASVGAGQRGLQQATMARGGDVTGATGVAGARMLESGHRELGDYTARLFGQHRREDEAGRRFDTRRSDDLARLAAGLVGGERDTAQHRLDQRRQMWTQLGSDVLGTGARVGAAMI